jgi:hypothetical protein
MVRSLASGERKAHISTVAANVEQQELVSAFLPHRPPSLGQDTLIPHTRPSSIFHLSLLHCPPLLHSSTSCSLRSLGPFSPPPTCSWTCFAPSYSITASMRRRRSILLPALPARARCSLARSCACRSMCATLCANFFVSLLRAFLTTAITDLRRAAPARPPPALANRLHAAHDCALSSVPARLDASARRDGPTPVPGRPCRAYICRARVREALHGACRIYASRSHQLSVIRAAVLC